MTFKSEFNDYVCVGDIITCELDGLTCTARVCMDEDGDRPDERDDGFWPSLDPSKAGYIGKKSKSALRRATLRAQAIMDAWYRDDWWYCGVAVTVERAGVQLTRSYDHALWGVERNYPTRGRKNRYLREVANELLPEAVRAVDIKIDELLEGMI